MKGLERSLSRGRLLRQEVYKLDIAINETIVIDGTAVGFGTVVIAGLPQGNLKLLGCVCNLTTLTKGDADIVDAFDGDFALGTTPLDDGTMTAGDVDIIASTALAQGVAGVSSGNRGASTATEEVIIDNTAGSLEVNLNVLVDDADISDDSSLIVVGSLHLALVPLGDD